MSISQGAESTATSNTYIPPSPTSPDARWAAFQGLKLRVEELSAELDRCHLEGMTMVTLLTEVQDLHARQLAMLEERVDSLSRPKYSSEEIAGTVAEAEMLNVWARDFRLGC